MEAVPRLPMISFELKISPDRPPTDFGKLKQYIRDFYNEDPESYSTEIHNLETLRATAVRPARDVTGCSVLKKYFCQLHFLQSRFPMGKDGTAAVSFTWRDAYASMVCTLADIRFEMVAILHNIGALHSQLGSADNRTSAEGLKLACTHFQCAAWAFQHLKDSYPQPAGVDVSPDLMQFMQQICLAQAQECILEKSMTDNRKATINAKVAAQIVDYYNMALNALVQTGGADDGCILETVGAKIFKSWKKYVKFKQTYYGCISLLYQGMQSEEQQKMGERVTYFQAAFDKLTEAIKLSKGLDQPEAVGETLAFTMDIVEGKRKAAKNENEFIYHEKVPERDELPDIKGAALVKGIPFSVNDPDISGTDIFSKLVPMKAHEASSLYSEEKAKLFRKVGAMIDEKDEALVGFMSSLQLDHLNAHLEPDILPQELIDRCAALSAKPDAIQNLIDAMDRLTDLYHDVDAMLKEILELIKIEEGAEKEYQEIMGSRPPSIVATDLTREGNKYKEAHAKAAESNETLHKAMAQHIANLRVMSLPLSELHKQLPSLNVLNLEDSKPLKDVQHLVGKVDEMRRQRSMLASQLRESVCNDDITSLLVTRPSENLQTIFTQELQKHSRYVSLIEQNLSAQEKILSALSDAYAEFTDTRKTIAEVIRQRNMILTALMSSYDAYEDLIAKSNKGLEFYRKLETNVTKLLQRVKGTCKVQEEEREQILIKNGKRLPSKQVPEVKDTKTTPSGGTGLKLKDYLQNMKKDGGVYSVSNPTNTVHNHYSNPATYGAVPNPVNQTVGYVEPLPGSDATQPWVPSVRPAPVGSEGNTGALPSTLEHTNKTPDLKADISQGYPYPTSNNYSAYDPQYYYRTAQSPAVSNPAYYNAVKPQEPLPANVATTSSSAYPQQPTLGNAATATSTASGVQYNPASYSPYSPAAGADNKYSNYQQAYQYQTANMQGYQQGYQLPNTQNPQGSLGQTGNAQSYNSASISPNIPAVGHNATNPVQDPMHQQTATGGVSNVQGYANSSTSSAAAYTTPTTYANQYAQYSNQAGYNYQTPVTGSYQYSGNYQIPNNLTYNWQQQQTQFQQQPQQQNYQPTQQPQPSPQQQQQNYQPTQQPQPSPQQQQQHYQPTQQPQPQPSPQQQQQNYQSTQQPQPSPQQHQQNYQQIQPPQPSPQQSPAPSPSPAPQQQSVGGVVDQKTWLQQNQYSGYTGTPTNNPYSGVYSNVSSNSSMPTSVANSQYPGQNYYPPTYPQQYQYAAEAGVSRYTHAGQVGITSQTNSSQTSVQGQTFAAQYNTQAQSVDAQSAEANQNYYSQQYGYQYNSSSGPSSQVTSPVVEQNQQQVTPMSPMTYMQASNSRMKMTYSEQPGPHSVQGDLAQQSDENEPSSNIDLLAGLDFSVNETPLVPEPSSKDIQLNASPVPSSTSKDLKTNLNQPENKGEGKLATLSIQTTTVAPASTITVTTPEKHHQDHLDTPSHVHTQLSKEDKSKLFLKDPFSDPDALSQFVTEVEKFEKFVDGLTSKTLNGPTPLDIKWKELQDVQEKDSQKLISVARCYPMKNIFPDILPYDVSRVELPSTKDDYINASHVKNISSNCPNFIAAQSPMPSTFADFWTMVLEQQVELVICLLNDMEIKENVYWPTIKGQEEKLGRITVNLQSTNLRKHWVERIISVTDGRLSRNVVHLQFTEWPGSSFPASPGPFLSLASESLSLWTQQRGSGPILVHCVAGVGRTGLFIVAIAAICEIQVGHGLPDLITLAASVSSWRKNSLHDREHFKFSYQTLLYYAQDMLMKRGILASRSSFEEKRPKSHTRHPSQDFLLGPPKEVSGTSPGSTEQTESNNYASENPELKNNSDPLKQIDPMWPIKRFQ